MHRDPRVRDRAAQAPVALGPPPARRRYTMGIKSPDGRFTRDRGPAAGLSFCPEAGTSAIRSGAVTAGSDPFGLRGMEHLVAVKSAGAHAVIVSSIRRRKREAHGQRHHRTGHADYL